MCGVSLSPNEPIQGRINSSGHAEIGGCRCIRISCVAYKQSRRGRKPEAKVPTVDTLIGTGGGKGWLGFSVRNGCSRIGQLTCCGVSR